MILQEFVFRENKEAKKALSRLNKIRKGKESYDDGIKTDCKCEWEGNCEDLCRHSQK